MVWIGSILCSLWATILDDVIKYYLNNSSDRTEPESLHLKIRIPILTIGSILCIVLINNLTPFMIKTIFEKVKDYIDNLDVDKLTYNALAPGRVGV